MIKLNQLLKEETFTATNKQTGKTSVFKTKDSRDAAIKAGTHTSKDDKTQSEPKVAGGDMFGGDYAKDRGAVSAKGGPGSGRRPAEAPKQGGDEILVVYKNKARINKTKSFTDADAARKFADANGGTLAKMVGGKLLAMPKTSVFTKDELPNTNRDTVINDPTISKSKWDNAPADSTKPWQAGSSNSSTAKSDMGVDKVVYNKRTKTVGIVRMADERGETKTDADGNVNTDELEPYNPMKYPHQKDAQVAPSTTKEIDSRGLWKPYSSNEGVIKLSKLMENDPCWKGYKQIGMKDKNGKEVPNCVPESVVKEAGIPKLYLKIEAVKNKIKALEAERKSKYGGEYARKLNAETDPKKKHELAKPIFAITQQIATQQKNLLSMLDMEERYYANMGKDDELDPNFA